MVNYCYKVKHKYLKKRKDGTYDIEDYFRRFEEEEGESEIFSIVYRLVPSAPLVRGDVAVFNDPKWQKAAKLTENLEKFEKEEGIRFAYDASTGNYTLIEDEEVLKDLEMIRICVDTVDKDTYGLLFILRSGGYLTYYNCSVLDANCPDIIKRLLEDGIIYKVRAPGETARKRRGSVKKNIAA